MGPDGVDYGCYRYELGVHGLVGAPVQGDVPVRPVVVDPGHVRAPLLFAVVAPVPLPVPSGDERELGPFLVGRIASGRRVDVASAAEAVADRVERRRVVSLIGSVHHSGLLRCLFGACGRRLQG